MEEKLYTIKAISRKLSIPESTLRKYRDVYLAYIPYIGTGRARRYRAGALEVFSQIREHRENSRLSWKETGEKLAAMYSRDASAPAARDHRDSEDNNPDNTPYYSNIHSNILENLEKALERIEFLFNTTVAEMIHIKEETAKSRERMSSLEAYIQEMARDRETVLSTLKNINESMKSTAVRSHSQPEKHALAPPAPGQRGASVNTETERVKKIDVEDPETLKKMLIEARMELVRYKNAARAAERAKEKKLDNSNTSPPGSSSHGAEPGNRSQNSTQRDEQKDTQQGGRNSFRETRRYFRKRDR